MRCFDNLVDNHNAILAGMTPDYLFITAPELRKRPDVIYMTVDVCLYVRVSSLARANSKYGRFLFNSGLTVLKLNYILFVTVCF